MALPASLSGLTTREAIQDTMYRGVLAFDTADVDLFESALTKDAVFDLNGNVMQGLDAIKTGCFNAVAKLDTTHFLTNIRIDVKEGASTAAVSCSALAQHYRQNEGLKPNSTRYMTGALYNINLNKDVQDGLWKVKYWNLRAIWTEGDLGVMTGN